MADLQGVKYSKPFTRRVVAAVEFFESQPKTRTELTRAPRRYVPQMPLHVRFPEGGVPARSGTQMGGPVTCQAITTNDNGVISDVTGFEPECWNWLTVVVGATGDRYGTILLHRDGKWYAENDDCQDVQGFSDGFTEGYN